MRIVIAVMLAFTVLIAVCQAGGGPAPRLVAETGHTRPVGFISYSADGERVVTTDRKTAIMWDAATGKELLTLASDQAEGRLKLPNDYGPPPTMSASFSPDGKQILTACSDGPARVWSAVSGEQARLIWNGTDQISYACYAPRGGRIVTLAKNCDVARVWDAATGRKLLDLSGDERPVASAAFSMDGDRIATLDADGTAKVWDAKTGRQSLSLHGPKETPSSIAFSPDGKHLGTAFVVTAKVWNAATGAEEATISRPIVPDGTRSYSSIAFSPDGSRVLTAEGTASLWDARTGKLLQRLPWDRGEATWAVFSPDGSRIATAMGFADSGMIWDAGTWGPRISLAGHTAELSGASFTSSGFYVAARRKGESPVTWIAKIGRPPLEINCQPPSPGTYGAVFSPSGSRVVTGGKTAAVWDTATGRRLLTLLEAQNRVNDTTVTMCFSSDGGKIAIGTFNQFSRVFDAGTGKLLEMLEGQGWVKVLAFSPDGNRLMTLQSPAIIWDLATSRKLLELPASGWWGNTTADYSADGSRVVTADLQGAVQVWDPATGKRLLAPAPVGPAVVSFSRFSPDGKMILTTHYDEPCRLWDAATGKTIRSFVALGNAAAGFSSDGKVVMVGSSHGTIEFWGASNGKELCTVTVFEDGNWTVISPDGRFDSSTGAEPRYLHWVIVDPKTKRLTAMPLAGFADKRYSPGLFGELVPAESPR